MSKGNDKPVWEVRILCNYDFSNDPKVESLHNKNDDQNQICEVSSDVLLEVFFCLETVQMIVNKISIVRTTILCPNINYVCIFNVIAEEFIFMFLPNDYEYSIAETEDQELCKTNQICFIPMQAKVIMIGELYTKCHWE